jgi:hypothetical protein
VLEGRFDAQLAAVGHRVAGVEGQVEEGVLELVGIHHRHQAGLAAGGGHGDGAGQRAADQLGHAEDQLIDLDRLGLQGLAAGKAEQAADQLGAPVGGVHGRLDEVFGEGVVGVVLLSATRLPMTTVSMLLKSWARPPVSWPMASIFWAWARAAWCAAAR